MKDISGRKYTKRERSGQPFKKACEATIRYDKLKSNQEETL